MTFTFDLIPILIVRMLGLRESGVLKDAKFGISSAENYWIARTEALDGITFFSKSLSLEGMITMTTKFSSK